MHHFSNKAILYNSCLLLVFSLLLAGPVVAGDVVVSGYVRDGSSGESLNSANLTFSGRQNFNVTSNAYGYYSISLPNGEYRLEVSYVGFQSQDIFLNAARDTVLSISLQPTGQLEEVVIPGNRARNQLHSPLMGLSRVEVKDLKKVPVLFGESDLLKTVQLLPGVMSGGEGSSQFFVRGGMGDQNLILLDGATVFNASHLFGFFSTFNSDAIKDVELYKGGMPAQYGGRLSSVLDIKMIEGNNRQFHVEGGLGLIASRIKLEGPLVREKSSFMISGRRTYADLFLKLSGNQDINQSKLYFYDLNLKANYHLNDRNSVFLSGYFGEDRLGYSDLFRFGWGNATATLRWNHILHNRLFSNTTFVYSDYDYQVDVLSENVDFVIASSIRNINLKQDFVHYTGPGSSLNFGADLRFHEIQPTQIDADESTAINNMPIEKRRGSEMAAYLAHEWNPTPSLSLNYGLRVTNFFLFGPGNFYDYGGLAGRGLADDLLPPAKFYKSGELVKYYLAFEPRISGNFRIDPNSSLKSSYHRTSQMIHQLSNTTSSLPTDAWVLSSNNIRPQIADQFSIGYYRNFSNNRYEASVEAYYKDMKNQIDYRDAADLQANTHLESELVYGKGRAYGLEWYLKKNSGKWNGWVSYTVSKSERHFEQIDGGAWFNARQDRTHDLSAVLIYELGQNWSLSGTFVFATGNAVSLPSGKYEVRGETFYYYTERNGYRMPDYHRLDLSATYDRPSGKHFSSSWSFGIYNAYNHRNAYIIDFRQNELQPQQTDIYRIALFGAIPAVTWNFKF